MSKDEGLSEARKFDELMFSIIEDFLSLGKECASGNVKNVIEMSRNYLDENVHEALENFHKLYFENKEVQKQSDDINSIIDHVVDSMQKDMNNGELSDANVKKATRILNIGEKERLSLSQAQKQIESLVAMQDSIKSDVAPIVASMQFEDLMRQRIEHLQVGYEKIKELDEHCTDLEIKEVIDYLESLCASKEEITEFYEEVKKEEPPKDFLSQSSVISF